ncbi:hypothetical protein DYQ05_02330 [Treponema pedis]|nr:hypothetical protein DYQ05_02330 [Treponema pedis]
MNSSTLKTLAAFALLAVKNKTAKLAEHAKKNEGERKTAVPRKHLADFALLAVKNKTARLAKHAKKNKGERKTAVPRKP